MDRITGKIIITTVILALTVGAVIASLGVYAHGEGDEAPWSGRQATPYNGMHGPMMGPMGAGHGRGYGGPGYMWSANYSGEHPCHEDDEMKEHWNQYNHARRAYNLTEITGRIISVDAGRGLIVVATEDGSEYYVKLMPVYVDRDNGYLVSGFWLAGKLAEALDGGETVDIVVETPGPLHSGVSIAAGIHVLGLDLASKIYYVHP